MADTYKIGEAANLLNLKAYVLRFWETEFPDIVPLRTAKGQRLYTEEHLALLERIRYLLHERGLTIGGARRVLAEEKNQGVAYVFGGEQTPREASAAPPPTVETASHHPRTLPFSNTAASPPAYVDPCRDPGQEDHGPPPAWPQERAAREQRFSQYNLPGVPRPAHPSMDATAPPEAADPRRSPEQEDYYSVSLVEDQRMLPLFGAVTAGTVGTAATVGASARQSAGHNFIQTGPAGSAPARPPEPVQEPGTAPTDAALATLQAQAARSRADMLDILGELENIAAILRR